MSQIPNFYYNDGNVAFTLGPGFYQQDLGELFRVSPDRVKLIDKTVESAAGHLCNNPDCSEHSNTFPKYESQEDQQNGMVATSSSEMISLVCSLIEPTNASELALVVYCVMSKAAKDQAQSSNPFSRMGSLMSSLFGERESSPESAIADLLKHKSDGNSQFGLTIDPTAYKISTSDKGPWEGFGISEATGTKINVTIAVAFAKAAQASNEDVATVITKLFNSYEFTSVAEQAYFCWVMGSYSNRLKAYHDMQAELLVGRTDDMLDGLVGSL